MNPETKISALMITFNEVNNIEEVMTSIDFADEIIVIDAYSTDGTFEKLTTFPNVVVIRREFKNFADQRNFALQQATYDWILFIDADERIPAELKEEINDQIQNPGAICGFMMKRLFYFKRKRIRFSGFQTDKTYRLFKNGSVRYNVDRFVHELPIIDGQSAILKNHMIHYCFDSYDQYKSKVEQYSQLKASQLFNNGMRNPNVYHFMIKPLYHFMINYLFRLGFLDGKEGFQICYLTAYGVWFRYKELKHLVALPKF